ncbi:hypothetical protein [Billgrantia endophytica]|uniref:hypothetical protein n=1 Tax=Billgrantia endophytica TaxID=2033802 RepID=UPI001F0C867F|nr:hypothetical protein [Halomonas endophytica]
MRQDNYTDVLQDSEIPDNISKEKMILLLDSMVKDIFLETFTRAFGKPDKTVKEKISKAHLAEVKEWIPNIVDAQEPSDVFVSSLERAIAKFGADVINRKHDGRARKSPDTGHVYAPHPDLGAGRAFRCLPGGSPPTIPSGGHQPRRRGRPSLHRLALGMGRLAMEKR